MEANQTSMHSPSAGSQLLSNSLEPDQIFFLLVW